MQIKKAIKKSPRSSPFKYIFIAFTALLLIGGILSFIQSRNYQSVLGLDSTETIKNPKITFDSEGFMNLNSKRFLPIVLYTGNDRRFIDKAKQIGVNTVKFLSNLNDSNLEPFEYAASQNLYILGSGYGYSPDSFTCDVRRLPHTYRDSKVDCSPCVNPGVDSTPEAKDICPSNVSSDAKDGAGNPAKCDYCDANFVQAYAKARKKLPNVLSIFPGADEPSAMYSYRDKKAFKLLKTAKDAFPGNFTFSADFVLCAIEKNPNSGKWRLLTDEPQYCHSSAKERVGYAINYFKDPNMDMPIGESGYFTPNDDEYFKQKGDIHQLVGTMEYFRQETGKKSIGSYLQVSESPTLAQVRSLFYASLAHQSRGIFIGFWNKFDDSRNETIFANLTQTIAELKENKIVNSYLKSKPVSGKFKVGKTAIDISAFKDEKTLYVIAINLTSIPQSTRIDFPALLNNTKVNVYSERSPINVTLKKGDTKYNFPFAPNQTVVLKFNDPTVFGL